MESWKTNSKYDESGGVDVDGYSSMDLRILDATYDYWDHGFDGVVVAADVDAVVQDDGDHQEFPQPIAETVR